MTEEFYLGFSITPQADQVGPEGRKGLEFLLVLALKDYFLSTL